MKDRILAIMEEMNRAGYICDHRVATVLYLAETMEKPVLIEGPAGVGKTSVAQAFSQARGLKMIRLQCYEGIDEARALYEWNYKKQLLHIQACSRREEKNIKELEEEIFSEEYLLARPLLKSITSPEKNVLLIDEIDKVDFEFEAMLLELLSEFQVTLPEMGTFKAKHIPFVFLTSNATRELSEALKRRCLYLYLSFPTPELETRIIQMKVPGLEESLREKVVKVIQQIRRLDLKKPPSIAESIDWAASLFWLAREDLDQDTIEETVSVLLKHQDDIEKVKNSLIFSDQGIFVAESRQRQSWR